MSLVQKLQAATGKKSLLDILKCAGISIALDGNWCETVMQLSGGTKTKLAGEDQIGNKFYEDVTRPYGRHRWVVFKDISNYNASSVHPHWHAWLHCMTDDTPVSKPPRKHKFDIEYVANPSGTPQRYLPKGSWENSHQRNWMKVQFWTPPN